MDEELKKYKEIVELLLRENKQINVDYRIRKKDGKFIDVFVVDTTAKKTTELQLFSLLNNMRNGLIRVKVDTKINVLYGNETFYRQTGFPQREFSDRIMGNNFLTIIHPDDGEAVLAKMQALLKSDSPQETVDFRIITKSNETCWISASISKLYEELPGESILQCVLKDITKEKAQARQNLLNEERFRIISEQTRDVIFEWNIKEDQLSYSPVYEKVFRTPPPDSLTIDRLLSSGMVHEDDQPIIRKMIDEITSTHSYGEATVRLRGADGTYFWARHRVTAIRDENGVTSHVLGIVTDVDDIVINTLDLQHKAEHDPLTGLFNRTTGQEMIQEILSSTHDRRCHAFVQFDIDYFKQINDFMGHAAGDFALQRIAQQMRDTFRDEDVLCRMGGDEFSVFLTDPGNASNVARKLTMFTKLVNRDLKFEEKTYPLSVSMGVALYPNDGQDFDQLYKHADQAMYQNKRKEGTLFSLYIPEETSEKGVR